jgi:hypothetical protein
MRATLPIVLVAGVAFADAAVPRGEAGAITPFVSGEKQGMAIAASEAAAEAIGRDKVPREPWAPLELPKGVVGIRFRRVLVLGTPEEVARAAVYLRANGSRRFRGRRFRMIGDMIFKHAGAAALRDLDADSRGKKMLGGRDQASGGMLLSCYDCVADEMLAAAAALSSPAQ